MGFDGKTLIHPSQIDFANAAFAPSAQAVEEAHAIVEAFADPVNAGKAVLNIGWPDGRAAPSGDGPPNPWRLPHRFG